MAAAYERGDALCGGIFGTGTNGAYVEEVAKITKMGYKAEELEKNRKAGLDKMVVNTECELYHDFSSSSPSPS
jgi:hexokinase